MALLFGRHTYEWTNTHSYHFLLCPNVTVLERQQADHVVGEQPE